MASRKEEIRLALKKKREKEGLNPENELNIVDLQDQNGEDIVVEDFTGKYSNEVIPFNTTPRVVKKGFVERIKGSFSFEEKEVKMIELQALEILSLQSKYESYSDEELANQTIELQTRIEKGESLDDILVEAYATIREAAYRVLGLRAFKVQLMGGITLHNGNIAEMKTGEGKTLTSIFPVYLNALSKKGVHVVTVNEYLARRDKEQNEQVFNFLGLTVGLNLREFKSHEKQEQHACDITYTTNAELGFDFLRDNMVVNVESKVLTRGLNFALVDEVDSILIDESRTPLIISGGRKNTAALYIQADRFIKSLKIEKEFDVDIETKSATLTTDGILAAEKAFKIDNLYDTEHSALVHHLNQALKANHIMTRDVEYMVATEDGSRDIRNASIMIIDQFTGRVMPGRSYSDGLHQAIEAKEGVPIKEETETRATITYQNFFRLFNKLAGMTGTALTEAEEFRLIYNMRVIPIPTNKPILREDSFDKVYSTQVYKYKAICKEVEKRNHFGQPILIGTTSVETSEVLSKMLTKRKIKHNVLNAKNHAKEAEMITLAGQRGAVTIATNMAGRGTDIKLGDGVKEIGGLAVIGSERHESRRIDNQLRGRSGRQGDPGYSSFYVSFEDELMQRFAGERLASFTKFLNEDEAIEVKMVSKAIESAQTRVEGQNFDSRKAVLQYDDVMRQHREIMYRERDDIMSLESLDDVIKGFFEQVSENLVNTYTKLDAKGKMKLQMNELLEAVQKGYVLQGTVSINDMDKAVNDPKVIVEPLTNLLFDQYNSRMSEYTLIDDRLTFERRVMISIIDFTWINHIDAMAKLRNGIHLRAYAQRDPLQEYTEEAFSMFAVMTSNIADGIIRNLVRMGIRPGSENETSIEPVEVELVV